MTPAVGRQRALRALTATSALLLGGCTIGGAGRPPWPPSPRVVEVEMSEFAFSPLPPVGAGRVVFSVRNIGQVRHELQFFPLADDIPPIDQQLRGTQRRILNPLAGVPGRDPGQTGTFSVELVVGQRYALICFLTDGGKPHATQGMNAEFRPRG